MELFIVVVIHELAPFLFFKNLSTRSETDSSMVMSGGQLRLKPSPASFFVASIPSLPPIAMSLVA